MEQLSQIDEKIRKLKLRYGINPIPWIDHEREKSNMEPDEQIIAGFKAMPIDEPQSVVNDYVHDGNLQMIMTINLALLDGDFSKSRVASKALSQFGEQGIHYVLEMIYRAPDRVAVFYFGILHYFEDSLVREIVRKELKRFTGFKRNQLRRFARRWWEFWK